ncbi:MAG: hypothetical protein HC881_14965, partial [Leptolyngbyaceae cyanobacterium SL_7_1]|nr:hypothetical protein [Leptolyngbyaceae cyanobacterium SL_7_1]
GGGDRATRQAGQGFKPHDSTSSQVQPPAIVPPQNGDRAAPPSPVGLGQPLLVNRAVDLGVAAVNPTNPTVSPSAPPATGRENPLVSTNPALVVPRSATLIPPPTVASRERSPSQPAEAQSVPSSPTIHITIGRIDVRAVTPPPPTRSRTTTAPARLSLEEYLRSRTGGDR